MLRIAIGLLAVGLASLAFWSSADGGEPLRVMTYNVRYASDQKPNAWPDRLPVARAMLQQYAPHVIGMQEALYRQVKDFDATLPNHEWIGLGRDGGSRGEFMAVFYLAERLEPLEFDHYWLSDTPEMIGSSTWGNSNRRMVTWVRFRDRSNDQEFYFLNTHFDHQIELARRKSAQLVLERSAKLTGAPVILVGDFNSPAQQGAVYDALVGEGRFRDSWLEADEKGELVGTFNGFRGPANASQQRIDWILLQGAIQVQSSEIVTFQQDGQYPSDHFPVIADLQWAK